MGGIAFGANDAFAGTEPQTASLTITGAGPVTMEAITADAQVGTLVIDTAASLTVTGGSPALSGSFTTLTLKGAGNITLGDADLTTSPTGVEDGSLSVLNASALTGNLSLGELQNIGEDFAFTSGTGVTTLTVTDDNLTNVDAGDLATDIDTWSFDLSKAAAGSQLHLDPATAFDLADNGVLDIKLGTNATLYLDKSMDLSGLQGLSITGAKNIVLADGATLKLTAAQASGLKIVAGPDVGNDGYTGKVEIIKLGDYTDLNANGRNDDTAELINYDFSGIKVAANATLADNDVTISAGSNLGTVAIDLTDVSNGYSLQDNNDLAGQTIRFSTQAQAARVINVDTTGGDTPSTNVVWLFDSITGRVNTSDYDSALTRLWFNQKLVTSHGGDVENLFTTLPTTILRVDFTDPAALSVLDQSAGVNREVEIVSFTDVSSTGLVFADQDRLEHVASLTIGLGGEVKLGKLDIGNIVNPVIDPATGNGVATPVFTTLAINSERAVRTGDLLAPEGYVNDNDGINEAKKNSDLDPVTPGDQTNANLTGNENVQPANLNTIGDIGISTPGALGLDLMNVVIDTGLVTTTGDSSAGAGARLKVGTITFDNDATAGVASLSVSGSNSVTVESLDTSDAQITGLTVTSTLSGADGILNVTGGSPAFDGGGATGNTETLTINNNAGGTINFGSAKAAPATGFWAGVYGEELSHLDVYNSGGTVNLGRIAEVDNKDFALNVTGTGAVNFTLGIADANGLKAPNLSDLSAIPTATGWSFTGNGATTTMTIENDAASTLDDAMFVAGGKMSLTNLNVTIAGKVNLSVLGTGLNVNTTNVVFNVPAGSELTLTAEQADRVDVDGAGTVHIVGDYGEQGAPADIHTYDLNELANTVNIDLSGITGLVDSDGTGNAYTPPNAVTLNLISETGAATFAHNVTGSNFADVITTGSGKDTINAGAGNDDITAGAGADLINGGAGNDTIHGFTAGDSVTGGADVDTLQLVGATTDFNAATDAQLVTVEIIEGTAGADLINTTHQTEGLTINGGAGNDTIIAGAGADSITGGAGADSIQAGAGNDTIVGSQEDVLLDGGADADVLQLGANFTSTSDAQIVNIETVTLTAAGLTVDLSNQGTTVGNTEGFTINAYANAALVTGVATNGTLTTPESSSYTLNGLTAGQSITIAGLTVTALADATAAQVADAFRGVAVTGLTLTGAFDAIATGWTGATLGGTGATLTFTNTANGDVSDLTASSTVGSTIIGGADNDTINGGNGADSLTGGAGADSILAGAGNDTIVGVQDDALLDGGQGTDTLEVGANFTSTGDAQIAAVEVVTLTAAATNLNLSNQTEGFTINGNAGVDTITGGSGNDTILGNGGNDVINGGAGSDSVYAGAGNDTIVGAQNDALLDGGADADLLQIGANFNDVNDAQVNAIETLNLTAAGLIVSMDAQTEGLTINAFANYAPVTGVASNGTAGTPEVSTFTLNAITAGQSVTINGLTVTATADAAAAQVADAFRGVAVAGLTLSGTSGTPADWTGAAIVGGTGATLTFTNTVNGDVTNYTASSTTVGSTIVGGLGADTINGSNGADSLTGGAGADSILAGAGNDTIVGAQGDALLDGGAGADVLQLGANFDDTGNGQIVAIETVNLTATGLAVKMDAQAEGLTINGFATGASTIVGGLGADTIIGGTGNDSLTGGAGVDSVDGGAGNDTIVVTTTANDGTDTLVGGTNTDTLQVNGVLEFTGNISGFEGVSLAQAATLLIAASELADNAITTVTGTSGGVVETVTFTGTGSADSIDLSGITSVTNATLEVNADNGNDDIVGSAFADSLNGEAGQDTITGGLGNDSMSGGDAADTFVFIADATAETDTISDWGVNGNNDAVSGALGAGDQLNVEMSPWVAGSASVAPTFTSASGGGNGVVNFATSYKVGDVITITFNGADSVSRTVQAGATSGVDVALAFKTVFESLTMSTSFDADLVNGAGAASVTAGLDGSAVLFITNDNGDNGAFTLNTSIATASGYVFDASTIAASNGVVSVTGNDGNDTITGGVGADTLKGGDGNDSIVGNGGADSIEGGAGADNLTGGAGADTFVFGATAALNGADTITDFVSGTDVLNVAAFETAGALVNITATPDLTTTAGTVYVLSGLAAGGADSAVAAAAALSGAANWTGANATAWVIVSDNNSSAIYEFVDTAASGDEVAATELTLVGTITGTVSARMLLSNLPRRHRLPR